MLEFIISKYNYWFYIIIMMIGLYAMISKKNLIKKIIGMNIFQTSIILFYISISYKKGGTLPILESAHAAHGGVEQAVPIANYINPLPHVLMLTAIVVGVATTGIALAVAIMVYKRYGTLEEDKIIEEMKR